MRRAPTNLRVRVVLPLVAAVVVLATTAGACTPEQFNAWWVSRGNQPLAGAELQRAADSATRFWAEVARRERFGATVEPISAQLARRMTPSSWRPGCPVALGSLRYLRVTHMDFAGRERVGELVVHADAAQVVVAALEHMWDERFPINSMRLVDDFGGSDDASMAANNTSAFNCRMVAGTSRWSTHAYGRAIDVNPVQNPYVHSGGFTPAGGGAYLDRSRVRPGMAVPGSPAVNAFTFLGWGWGGNWRSSRDYQHFSANGR